jgi:formate hydrogenlyase subunit 6/NADH:ubiquinone oxidoreductase subunit I
LWKARRTGEGFEVSDSNPEVPRRALLGVRACELHAMAVQDRVFLDRTGQISDPYYARARERLFVVAVECEHPGGSCFCSSMGTGPEISEQGRVANNLKSRSTASPAGARQSLPLAKEPSAPPAIQFDLALTELDHTFVARAGSDAGQHVIARLGLTSASTSEVEDGQHRVRAAATKMGRSLDVTEIHDLLHRNQENPSWNDVATRCLSCTNCTLVCPTCFCSSVEDVTDLSLENAERVRHWDSCFNPEFAHVHGGNFRASIRGRYRQWLTHKFASWFDQFDVSGCVGCGRCITWCPVGIDVTEEIAAIRAADGKQDTPS